MVDRTLPRRRVPIFPVARVKGKPHTRHNVQAARSAENDRVARTTYTEHSMQSAQSAHPSLPMMLVPSALVGPAPDK